MAPKTRRLIRNLVIELLLYGALVTAYAVIVWHLLDEPLVRYFRDNPRVYAFLGLGLIVAQGIFLDAVTSFLVNALGLGYSE